MEILIVYEIEKKERENYRNGKMNKEISQETFFEQKLKKIFLHTVHNLKLKIIAINEIEIE